LVDQVKKTRKGLQGILVYGMDVSDPENPIIRAMQVDKYGRLVIDPEDLDTRYLKLDGSNKMKGDIIPETSLTYDLGSSTKKWAYAWMSRLNPDFFANHLLPAVTNTYDVGASTRIWDEEITQLLLTNTAQAAHTVDIRIEHRSRSLTLAETKLEDIKARSIYNYSTDFNDPSSSIEGAYLCKVTDTTVSSDLRTILLSVGYDQNGDSTLESSEIEVTLKTLLARRW